MIKKNTYKILMKILVVVLVALLGCTGGDSRNNLRSGDWVGHGFSEVQRSELKNIMMDAVEVDEIAGCAVLLIHRGEVIFKEAAGYADIETGQSFGVDDVCALASVTKPYTATLLMMLKEDGALSLDDPIAKYLPEFKDIRVKDKGRARRIPTIRQALSHTAGFRSGNDFRSEMLPIVENGTLTEMVRFLTGRELLFEPGTKYFYTSMGYFIAGRIAEVVSGKEFSELLQQRLLQPINARSTAFHPSEAVLNNVPIFYSRTERGFQSQESRFRGSCVRPGGGLYATLEDVGKFMLLHRNKGMVNDYRIVSSEILAMMYQPQPNTEHGYALGFNVLKRNSEDRGVRIMHLGASGTLCWLDFDLDLIVVLFTQMPQKQIQPFRIRLLNTIENIFTGAIN